MKSGAVLDSRYHLVKLLGRGAMGAVWQATDLKIRRSVAVKIVLDHTDRRLVDRMGREATAAGLLSHPHIATVHDYGQTQYDGVPITYIVMELVDGRPLTSVLADGKPELSVVLEWARQITLALGAAHAPKVGVVHRDLKPDNVLITSDGRVKLVDFGIARFISDHHAEHTQLTAPGVLIGTPAYMAPEQCLSKPVDGRTDLYALGCLLYEMVTGNPPFAHGSPFAVAFAQVHENPAAPRSHNDAVPTELDLLIRDLLAKEPGLRPADAAAVYERLGAIAAGGHRVSPTSSRPRALIPTPRAPVLGPEPTELHHQSNDLERPTVEDDSLTVRLWRGTAAEPAESSDSYQVPTLTTRHALAWRVGASGNHAEAVRLWQELIPDLQYVFGHFHPTTHTAQRILAWNMMTAGDPDQAVRQLVELIPDSTRLLGRQHMDVLEARRFLVWSVGEMGNHSRAVRLLRKLVRDLSSALGTDHEHTLEARRLLAWNTERSGDHVKAIRLLRELIQDADRALGPDHEQCAEARRLLDRYTH